MPQVIKLVNATALDDGLTEIADAIRTKGGTSADLTFPDEFISAIGAIPTGGGGMPMHTGSFVGSNDRNETVAVDALYSHIYIHAANVKSDDSLNNAPYGGYAILGFYADNNTGFRYIVTTTAAGTALLGGAGAIGRWGGNTQWTDRVEFSSQTIKMNNLAISGAGAVFSSSLTYNWEAW